MKRPWQIWLLLALCLAIVLPAMTWLTVKALESDRAEAQARRQTEEARRKETEARRQAELARSQADLARREAELQELISSALWRMDWTLTPLVAQEAARPYFAYQPIVNVPASGKTKVGFQQLPSPLLMSPSPFVKLHFQISSDGKWSSPQNPVGPMCEVAISNGISEDLICESGELLDELKSSAELNDFVALLPDEMLPRFEVEERQWLGNNVTWNYVGNSLQQATPQLSAVNLNPPTQSDFPQYQQENDIQQVAQQQAESLPNANPPPAQPQRTTQQEYRPSRGTQPPLNNGEEAASQGSDRQPGSQAPTPLMRGPAGQNPEGQYARTKEQLAQRGGKEFEVRNRAFNSFYQHQVFQQRLNDNNTRLQLNQPPATPAKVSEGHFRSIWVGDNLLLARRVLRNDQLMVQGCWLDWDRIKTMLLTEVQDLFPDAELLPIQSGEVVTPGRRLATLPVRLLVPEPTMTAAVLEFDVAPNVTAESKQISPIQFSLVVAWICLGLAMVAVAVFLRGVISLSERRGAFVSAVTHELRTPLTTFRMYAEMLAEGMVPDETKQQRYLDTLRVESDRLYHLVENVLAYARLERGRHGSRREELSAGELVGRVESRLTDRAAQAEMKLAIEFDSGVEKNVVSTDPGAVEQILFNLVDNACKYAGVREDSQIHLEVRSSPDHVSIAIRDHGPGISDLDRSRLFRPFSKSVDEAAHSAPGVGLGLALCRRLAKAIGGRLEFDAACASGACFVLDLPRTS